MTDIKLITAGIMRVSEVEVQVNSKKWGQGFLR